MSKVADGAISSDTLQRAKTSWRAEFDGKNGIVQILYLQYDIT